MSYLEASIIPGRVANHNIAREKAGIFSSQCAKNEPPKSGNAKILNVPDATLKIVKTIRLNLRYCSVGVFHEDDVGRLGRHSQRDNEEKTPNSVNVERELARKR